MRQTLIFAALCTASLAACAPGDGAFTNPLTGLQNVITTPERQRGAVELAVKSNFTAVLADLNAGSGPALTAAFDAAGVPVQDRSTRVFQLQRDADLYAANPGALTSALLLYGGRTS
jgi:hypothetical protein